MACAAPITIKTEHGPVRTRCRQCLPCRIQTQSSLTFRCLLENYAAPSGWFLTLTYAEAPPVGSYSDMQMFLDRLRVRNRRAGNSLPIRYLAIGEYGDRFGRFHYHALIWNSLPFSQADWDTALWPSGFVKIGQVTPASIRYTVGYTLKFLSKNERLPNGRSRRPPLGAPAMTLLGEAARGRLSPDLPVPTSIMWDGKRWPLDNAMQIAWMTGYDPTRIKIDAAGTRSLERSIVDMILDTKTILREGDPLMRERLAWERRALHQARDRRSRGKL